MMINFLGGLVLGLIGSLIHFIIIYSLAPIVRTHKAARLLASNTVRPWAQRMALVERSHRSLHVVSVHGFLMFGSSPQLGRDVQSLIEAHEKQASSPAAAFPSAPNIAAPAPWFIIVDLASCKGCDFGAVQELLKLHEAVTSAGGTLRVTLPPQHVRAALECGSAGRLGSFDDLQQTLRECEDSIIAAGMLPGSPTGALTPRTESDLGAVLCALSDPAHQPPAAHVKLAEVLLQLGERRTVNHGDVVWQEQNEPTFFIYVLEGELTLYHQGQKIEVILPGSTLGFLFMLNRAATGGQRETTLICVHPRGGTLLLVSRDLFDQMRISHPELERLMKDSMIRRIAYEYHHWISHHDHRGGPTHASEEALLAVR